MSSIHRSPNHPTIVETVEELRKLKKICFPIGAINLTAYLRSMITVTCLGRLGSLELAGGALAVGFTNITGYSVLSGLAVGAEPLCSQAFGSGNLPLVARTLRKATIMLLLVSIPIAILWSNVETIMLWLGQDAKITRVASRYCLYGLPDLLANSLLQPIRVYFRSKGTPMPLMWCTTLAVLLHLPLTLFMSRMGVPGVALATCCTNFNTLLFLLIYIWLTRTDEETLTSEASDSEWGSLVRLAVPSCLGVCLEWWWYELMTLASGYLPRPHVTLSVSAILIQTTALMYAIPASLGSSASARVGIELGAGRPRNARIASALAMGVAVLVSYVGLLFAGFGRSWWVRLFSKDPQVVQLAMAILPVVGFCELGNCLQTTGCGVLRGSARPSAGAFINLCAFYLVGAPVGVLLAFKANMGFMGFCFGLLAAQVVCAFSVVGVICGTDWDTETRRAKELVGLVSLTAAALTGPSVHGKSADAGVLLQHQGFALEP